MHMPMALRLEINEAAHGESARWYWSIRKNIGDGREELIAKGDTLTADGALYAAVMEARLHRPDFSPPPQPKATPDIGGKAWGGKRCDGCRGTGPHNDDCANR